MADSGPAGGAALAAPAPGPGSGGPGPRVYFQSPPGAAGEGPGDADDEGPVRRQGKVTVKYDRKELRKRLNLEEWILEQLTRLYDCQVCSPPRVAPKVGPEPACPGAPPPAACHRSEGRPASARIALRTASPLRVCSFLSDISLSDPASLLPLPK